MTFYILYGFCQFIFSSACSEPGHFPLSHVQGAATAHACAAAYLYDIIKDNDTWSAHVQMMAMMQESLRQVGLLAAPKECALDIRRYSIWCTTWGWAGAPSNRKDSGNRILPDPQNQKQRWGGFAALVSCYHFIYWLAPLPTCFVSKRINCVQREVVWAKECLAIQGWPTFKFKIERELPPISIVTSY